MDYSISTLGELHFQTMDMSKSEYRSRLRRWGSPFANKVRFSNWTHGRGWETIDGASNPPHWRGPPNTFPWAQYAVDLFFKWFLNNCHSQDWIDLTVQYPVRQPVAGNARDRSKSPDPAPAPARVPRARSPAPGRVVPCAPRQGGFASVPKIRQYSLDLVLPNVYVRIC